MLLRFAVFVGVAGVDANDTNDADDVDVVAAVWCALFVVCLVFTVVC